MRRFVFFLLAFALASPAPAIWGPCTVLEGLDHSSSPPTPARLSVVSLSAVAPGERARVRTEIIAAAQQFYDAGRAQGRDTIFPIAPELYDGIARADARTQLSQVVVDDSGRVVGFVLAYYNPESQTVHLEKIGVLPEFRAQRLMSTMLHATMLRAQALGIRNTDLLVVKTNVDAQTAYERIGFTNVTPPQFRRDPRYNAFAFAAPVEEVLRLTAPTPAP